MFEPAHLFTFAKRPVGRENGRFARVEHQIGKAQANAGDEDRGYGNKCDELIAGCEAGANNDTLVAAKKLLNPRQGSWVEVPCVAPDVCHVLGSTIVRSMKAMIHAGSQAQCGIAAVVVGRGQRAVAKQFLQRIRRAFHLQELGAGDATAGSNDPITRSNKRVGVMINGTRAFLQLADETVTQTGEVRLLGLTKIEIGEKAPDGDGEITDERLLDGAEPTNQTRGEPPRNAIGKNEIEAFVLAELDDKSSRAHVSASGIG